MHLYRTLSTNHILSLASNQVFFAKIIPNKKAKMQINYTLAIMDNNTAFSCRSQLIAKSAVGFYRVLKTVFMADLLPRLVKLHCLRQLLHYFLNCRHSFGQSRFRA